MTALFLCGPLCHPPLRAAVLGRDSTLAPARLPGHALRAARFALGTATPVPAQALLLHGEGDVAGGVLTDPTEEDRDRLSYYFAGFGAHPVQVTLGDGSRARAWRHDPAQGGTLGIAPDGPWPGAGTAPEAWTAAWSGIATAAAGDFMAGRGQVAAEVAGRRYPMMLARAASRLRAAAPKPARLRHLAASGDIELVARDTPYARFFSVESYRLRHRLFSGGIGAEVERAVFVSCDAVSVLPYDPVRDRVHVIEQFRPAPYARGDANPWLIEAIAGRVDAGESIEDTARREAREEAGLELGRLIQGPGFYPSPGAKTEYVYTFIGLADLPDAAARTGGLAEEDEDIRAHLLSFAELDALVESGECDNGVLLLQALWLARIRPQLREEFG